MTNETSAERIQRRWNEGAPEREARRAQANPIRRGLGKLWAAVIVLLLVAVLLGLVALIVWFLAVSAVTIVKFAGAVLIVVVIALAWRQIRGH